MPDALADAATPGATAFPVLLSVRNPGSIVDNDPTGQYLAGGKVTGTITAATDWVPFSVGDVAEAGTYAAMPAFAPITIAAGTKAAFWFRFADGTRPMRANPPKLETAPPYQVFNYTDDGLLGITWAMQVGRASMLGLAGSAWLSPPQSLC